MGVFIWLLIGLVALFGPAFLFVGYALALTALYWLVATGAVVFIPIMLVLLIKRHDENKLMQRHSLTREQVRRL